mmetsp:Transcript_21461/g.29514  ORF Transcript_21461/g.29514 Transcript_21461/m.29514 type:complete len:160 (+) Transcript_21461:60-539(+)
MSVFRRNYRDFIFATIALLMAFYCNFSEAFQARKSNFLCKFTVPLKHKSVTMIEMSTKKVIVGKAELLEILKEKTGLPKKSLESALIALTDTIKEKVLHDGIDIRIKDFGTFKQKVTSARKGRNPRTGEELQIASTTSISFSVSSSLKIRDGEDDTDEE